MSINKKIICHPNNYEKLKKVVQDAAGASPDFYMPFGYEIVVDDYLPEFEEKETGKLLWKKNKFINYEEPADPDMPWEDYLEMALWFGWCEKEVVREMVFYEVNLGQSNFLDVLDASSALSDWFKPPQLSKGIGFM